MIRAARAKPRRKRGLFANLAATSGLSKKQVAAIMDALAAEIEYNLGDQGAGFIKIPGLMKIEKKTFPARPAQSGVPSLFRPGEVRDIAAKPAHSKIKVRALKRLRAMAT